MKLLAITENLQQTMKERYFQKGETTPQEMIMRVAKFVAEGEYKYGCTDGTVEFLTNEYFNTMNQRLWLPSSPFLMNAGTKVPMLSACFVIGGMQDNLESIYTAVARQGIVNKMGGGTGFNFSVLREEGASIGSTGGTSSGVMSFMEMFNVNGEVIKQGGRRRSANMGILRVDHPEILKFIDYKTDHSKLTNFNISVLVDDEFMRKVEAGEDYNLISPRRNKVVGKLNAKEVFMKIMHNNWKSAEPAIIFVDNLNKHNPMVKHLGYIVTTNPCGEITLYGDEACNLASINLEEFVDWNGQVDWALLRYVTRLVTRFLDTSLDVNLFPDKKIDKMVKSLRRLGLGIMSLHGAVIKAGYKYSSPEGRKFAKELQQFITDESWKMSEDLAQEKGVFPLWDKSEFATTGRKVRNVAVTTIAPTGTIQQILNTSSSGCEPIFALAYQRNILMADGTKKATFWVNPFFQEFAEAKGFWNDELPEKIYNNRGRAVGIPEIPQEYAELFETAMEISAKDHVLMQAVLQEHIDNSISKTINMPREATVEEVAEAYMLGWKSGLKGMTIYREGSRDGVVLSVGGSDEKKEDKVQLARGEIKVAPEESGESRTVRLDTGCGTMYLTMTKDDNGDIDQTFVSKGAKGTCMSNQTAVSRLVSLALRGGVKVEDVIDQLLSCPSCPSYYGKKCSGGKVSKGSNCPSAIAFQLKEYVNLQRDIENGTVKVEKVPEVKKHEENHASICPKCGEQAFASEGGCGTCYACGFGLCS